VTKRLKNKKSRLFELNLTLKDEYWTKEDTYGIKEGDFFNYLG